MIETSSIDSGGLPRRRGKSIADYEQDFIRQFGEDAVTIALGCLRSVANFVEGSSAQKTTVRQPLACAERVHSTSPDHGH